MLSVFGLILDYTGLLYKLMVKCGAYAPPREQFINEGLGNYYDTIPCWVRKIMYTEEIYMKQHLDIQTYQQRNLELLRSAKKRVRKTSIKGDMTRLMLRGTPPNYDMLANRAYREKFQFTPIQLRPLKDGGKLDQFLYRMIYSGFHPDGRVRATDDCLTVDYEEECSKRRTAEAE